MTHCVSVAMAIVAMGFCGLWDIVMSPDRLSSYPCMYLALVVTVSATMMVTVGSCGMLGILLSPNRQSLITSPDLVLVKTKLFYSHASLLS